MPKLTPTEERLLKALSQEPGRVMTRAELSALAMPDAVVLERTVDVHVKSLRRKLAPTLGAIEAVRGKGYRFVLPSSKESK